VRVSNLSVFRIMNSISKAMQGLRTRVLDNPSSFTCRMNVRIEVVDPLSALERTKRFMIDSGVLERRKLETTRALVSILDEFLIAPGCTVSTRMDMNGKHIVTNDIEEAMLYSIRGAQVSFTGDLNQVPNPDVLAHPLSPIQIIQSPQNTVTKQPTEDIINIPLILRHLRVIRPYIEDRRIYSVDENVLNILSFLDPKRERMVQETIHEFLEIVSAMNSLPVSQRSTEITLSGQTPLPDFAVVHACLAALNPVAAQQSHVLRILGSEKMHDSVARFCRFIDKELQFQIYRDQEPHRDPNRLALFAGASHLLDNDPFMLASQHLQASDTLSNVHEYEFTEINCRKPLIDSTVV
jgi:hypothetical protein